MLVMRMGRKRRRRGFVDGVLGALAFAAFGLECEVDYQDGVLLHDADEQDDTDHGNDTEVVAGEHEGEQRADAGGGERGEDGEGLHQALVEHASTM